MCPGTSIAAEGPRSQACLMPVNDCRRKKFTLPALEADGTQKVFDFTPLPF